MLSQRIEHYSLVWLQQPISPRQWRSWCNKLMGSTNSTKWRNCGVGEAKCQFVKAVDQPDGQIMVVAGVVVNRYGWNGSGEIREGILCELILENRDWNVLIPQDAEMNPHALDAAYCEYTGGMAIVG